MKVSKENMIMCENRNAELLMEEVFKSEPNAQIDILTDEITEHEALLLYHAVKTLERRCNRMSCVYVPLIRMA